MNHLQPFRDQVWGFLEIIVNSKHIFDEGNCFTDRMHQCNEINRKGPLRKVIFRAALGGFGHVFLYNLITADVLANILQPQTSTIAPLDRSRSLWFGLLQHPEKYDRSLFEWPRSDFSFAASHILKYRLAELEKIFILLIRIYCWIFSRL